MKIPSTKSPNIDRFILLGFYSILILLSTDIFALSTYNVNLQHYWDGSTAWIGPTKKKLIFELSMASGETVYAIDIAFKNVFLPTFVDATGPNITCSIEEFVGDNDGTCEYFEYCIVSCEIDLSRFNQGSSYYLAVGFDLDNNTTSGQIIGDVGAEVVYYWVRNDTSQSLENTLSPTPIKEDETPPTVVFIPSNQTWTNMNITINISADDGETDIYKIYYKVLEYTKYIKSGCPPPNPDYDGYLEYSSPVMLSDEGEWVICAYAIDTVGNYPSSAAVSGRYQIDRTPPTVSITYPYPNAHVNSTSITISWKYFDTLSGFQKAEIDCNNDGSIDGTITNNTTTSYICTYTSDGTYTVKATIYDQAGNSNSATVSFTIDTVSPEISFQISNEYIKAGDTLTLDIRIIGENNYTFSGIVQINCSEIGDTSTTTSTLTWNGKEWIGTTTCAVGNVSDGTKTITVIAQDNAGNIGESYKTVIVDNTPPNVVEIISPTNSSRINGISTIIVIANDSLSGIGKVEFFYCDATTGCDSAPDWQSMGIDLDGSNGWNISWNTSQVSDGKYLIKARAYDQAGNYVNSIPITVIIDNTNPFIQKIVQMDLTHVKVIFSEKVKTNDTIKIIGSVKVWDNGNITTENATIICNPFEELQEVICITDKPLTEGTLLGVSGNITDLVGNPLEAGTTLVENTADILFKIPANRWIYIALEYELDTEYIPFNEFLNTISGAILTYSYNGSWTRAIPAHPLLGYAIKVEASNSSVYYLPVKYKETLSKEAKKIVLSKGWNLIAVIGDPSTRNNAIDIFSDVSITSLESLAALYGQRYYKFAWIINALTGEYKAGNSITNLNNWIKDYTPYWVYMLEEAEYVIPAQPSP